VSIRAGGSAQWTQQVKEIDVERLRQLAEQQKAQIHIPFHSLRQSDEPQQTVLEKADHALVGEAHPHLHVPSLGHILLGTRCKCTYAALVSPY
jgi:hypothetical protein